MDIENIDFFLTNSYIFMHTISKNSATKPKSLKENHKFYPGKNIFASLVLRSENL